MKGGRGKNLPDEDHVLRYAAWGRLRKDGDDNVVGLLPQALRRRDGEDYLSVNWLEFHDGDRETQIRLSVWAMRETLSVGPKGAFGVGNVGEIKRQCQAAGARVRVVHGPEDQNPAHSGIRQLPRDNDELLEALAAEAFVELVRNADVAQKD